MKLISILLLAILNLYSGTSFAEASVKVPQVYALECPAPLGLISSARYQWIKSGDPIYPKQYFSSIDDYLRYSSGLKSLLLPSMYKQLKWYYHHYYGNHHGYMWEPKERPNIEWKKGVRIPTASLGLPESVDGCKVVPLTANTRFSSIEAVGDQDSYDRLTPLDQAIVDGQLLGNDPSNLQLIFSDKINALNIKDYFAYITKNTSWASFRYGGFEVTKCEWWNAEKPKTCRKLNDSGDDDTPFYNFNKISFYENGEVSSATDGYGVVPFKLNQKSDDYRLKYFCSDDVRYRPDGTLRRCGNGLVSGDNIEKVDGGSHSFYGHTPILLYTNSLQFYEGDRIVGVIADQVRGDYPIPSIFKTYGFLGGSATQFDNEGNIYSGTFAKLRKDGKYGPSDFAYLTLNPNGTIRHSEKGHKDSFLQDQIRVFKNETSEAKEFEIEKRFDVLSMKIHYSETDPECAPIIQKQRSVIVSAGCAAAVLFYVEERREK